MKYYVWHIGDYATSTRHLSWDEDIAYRRMIDLYHQTEKPLPADLDQLCKIIGASTECQRNAVAYVSQCFFTANAERLYNKRCDEDIKKYKSRSTNAKESAAKRWIRKEKPRHAKALPTQCVAYANQQPIIRKGGTDDAAPEGASSVPEPRLQKLMQTPFMRKAG